MFLCNHLFLQEILVDFPKALAPKARLPGAARMHRIKAKRTARWAAGEEQNRRKGLVFS
jgi:hypothetical protein